MILELVAKPFPTEGKPSKCLTKEKTGKEKQKKQGQEKAKGKRQGSAGKLLRNFAFYACLNFQSCNLAS